MVQSDESDYPNRKIPISLEENWPVDKFSPWFIDTITPFHLQNAGK